MKKSFLLCLCGLLTALSLGSCAAPSGVGGSTSAQTGAHAPVESGAPADTEAESKPGTEPETKPRSNRVYREGVVENSPFEEPPSDVVAVRVDLGEESAVMYLRTSSPGDFCPGDRVAFSYDPTAETTELEGYPITVALTLRHLPMDGPVDEKPVIYLYPEAPTEVSVKLTLNGRLTCTYPAYGEGWEGFIAHPDGTLVAPDGREYYCLYWEGVQDTVYDFSRGFCVKGSDTAAFLEWALAAQGLSAREANEFIIYWLPRMEGNPYNVISFQTEAYTDGAVLEISPKPDSLLRVFMAYYPSDYPVELAPQGFEPFERRGFAAVEWGGCQVGRP